MKPNLYSNQEKSKSESFHSITTDNLRFQDLGLGVFTTGTLYDWICTLPQGPKRVDFEYIGAVYDRIRGEPDTPSEEDYYKQQVGQYKNLRFWLNKFSGTVSSTSNSLYSQLPLQNIFEPIAASIDESCSRYEFPYTVSFYAWRNSGRNGEYILVKGGGDTEQDVMNWEFSEGSENYRWSDLRIEDLVGRTYNRNSKYLYNIEKFPLGSRGDSLLIRNIIEMNNYVNTLRSVNYNDWTSTDRARYRFIQDIKSSKYGCLEWKANITFLLDIPNVLVEEGISLDGCNDCAKEVTTTFKLRLFGIDTKKRTGRSVASTDTTIIQTKTTPVGTPYIYRDETGADPPSINPSPRNGTAGELSNHYVPLEGKFESGTTQVFAIMTEDLPGAEQPTVQETLEEDSPFLTNKSTGFGVQTGKAVVVSMQNANPKQWMPDFASPRKCRNKDNTKVVLTVHNPTSRSFTKGENVILQKLDGVWVPLSVGEGSASIAPADPNWDFMYLMTNSMFFFRNHDWVRKQAKRGNTKLTDWDDIGGEDQTISKPNNYEQSFYYNYYRRQEEQERQQVSFTNPSIIDITDNQQRYPTSVFHYAGVINGYMQVTSWDFMGIGIGGTRRNMSANSNPVLSEAAATGEAYAGDDGINGNALSTTQFSIDTNGNPFDNGGIDGKFNSYPFFGCVFPEGYQAQSQYAELMADDTDFFLAPKNFQSTNDKYEANGKFFYASNGKPFENLNNVANAITTTKHQEAGMFPQSEVGTLKHLPADIGTNCEPSGTYGRPISNIGMIGSLNHHIGDLTFRNTVADYFQDDNQGQPKRYSWMHKKDRTQADVNKTHENAQDFIYDYSDSVFDLQPMNSSKIEFRPLSQEVYACFESINFAPNTNRVSFDGLYDHLGVGTDKRGKFSVNGYQFVQAWFNADISPYVPVISPFALYRNPQIVQVPVIADLTDVNDGSSNITKDLTLYHTYRTTNTPDNTNGLKYNIDLAESTLGSPVGHLPEGPNHSSQRWFDENWMTQDLSPAGAVGVIGAVATFATRDALQFVTENAVGLDDYIVGIGAGSDYFPSYRGGDYATLDTTQLYARVYQQWPRDQMIYDPRFFVVHHFNDGIKISRDTVNKEYYVNGSPIDREPTEEELSEGYPLGAYEVDKKEADVDFRIPTSWNNSLFEVGGYVYSDSKNAILNEPHAEAVSKIREKSHWRIQPQRRGKLLPYTYSNVTIGISKEPKQGTLLEGQFASAKLHDIVIINPGSKYGKGDTFKLSGASGGGVVLKAKTLNDEGGVRTFEVLEVGLVFDTNDFLSSDQEMRWETGGSSPTAPTSIIAREVDKGTGLEAYVIRGRMTTTKMTDTKPAEALETTGPIKLGPDPSLANSAVLQLQQTDPKNQILKINPNARSKNNQYDVFFHYHNDISHNRVSETGPPNGVEQMIRLNVITDGGGGSAGSLTSNAQGVGSDIDFPPGGGPDQFAGSDWAFQSNGFGGGFLNGAGDFFGAGGIGGGGF